MCGERFVNLWVAWYPLAFFDAVGGGFDSFISGFIEMQVITLATNFPDPGNPIKYEWPRSSAYNKPILMCITISHSHFAAWNLVNFQLMAVLHARKQSHVIKQGKQFL